MLPSFVLVDAWLFVPRYGAVMDGGSSDQDLALLSRLNALKASNVDFKFQSIPLGHPRFRVE